MCLNGPLKVFTARLPAALGLLRPFKTSGTTAGPYHVTVGPLLEMLSVPITGFHSGKVLQP